MSIAIGVREGRDMSIAIGVREDRALRLVFRQGHRKCASVHGAYLDRDMNSIGMVADEHRHAAGGQRKGHHIEEARAFVAADSAPAPVSAAFQAGKENECKGSGVHDFKFSCLPPPTLGKMASVTRKHGVYERLHCRRRCSLERDRQPPIPCRRRSLWRMWLR